MIKFPKGSKEILKLLIGPYKTKSIALSVLPSIKKKIVKEAFITRIFWEIGYNFGMKLASIDVGLKRIGVAICLDGKIVLPQNAILRKNRNQAAHDVKTFITEWEIEKLIVGLPKEGSSSEEMERRIRHFVSLLELKIPVAYQDEQNSSVEA